MAHDINRTIAATEANLHRLRTDQTQSEAMVVRYRTDAIRLNAEGNDKPGVQRAQQAALAAQLAAEVDAGSISVVETLLTKQIAERDSAIDKKIRAESGNEIEAQLRASGDIARDLDDALKRLEDFTGWASPFIPDAKGLLGLCTTLRAQIPAEVAMIQKIVGYHGAAVMAGTAPATIKRPPAPIVQPIVAKPVVVSVFCLRSIKWREPISGKLMSAQKFQDALMPPELARIALETRACVRMDDPMRAQHNNTVAGHVNLETAFDLDVALKGTDAATATGPRLVADPIRASNSNPQFQITVGEPKKAYVS